MTTAAFTPPFIAPAELPAALREQGYAVLSPQGVGEWLGAPIAQLDALHADWDGLPPDDYLKDGGRYRTRRHACFTIEADDHATLTQVPHRAHWQPVEYNALHGGMQRWFAPMLDATVAQPVWQRLLRQLGKACSDMRGTTQQRWYVEAHQFRIDTAGGIGRPTPEGAHRDGVDLVAVALVVRRGASALIW